MMFRSFTYLWHWFEDRTGLPSAVRQIARHPVPPDIGWGYVFGSATLIAFVIQVVTGIALATVYVPSTESAYQTLQFITHQAWLGNLIRGLHAFGASAMIVLMGIHMIRVFLWASYKFPREMNWLTGVGLFALTLIMSFTGQLMRWDANGVWSVFILVEMVGRVPLIGTWLAHFLLAGETVSAATLSRFYAVHVFLVPAMLFAFIGMHLYLVIRNGISEPPKAGQIVDPKTYRDGYHTLLERHGRPFWPDAAWRDAVFGVAVIAVLVCLAWWVGPPELTSPPDPTSIRAYPRPDWYFLWIFAILAQIPPELETYVIILGPLCLFGVLILLPLIANRGERSPMRRPWAVGFVLVITMMIGTLWRAGVVSPWSPDFSAQPLPPQVIGATRGPVYQGGELFHAKGCEFCHAIAGYGGHRGPELTNIGNQLTPEEMTIRILNGGKLMPAYAGNLKPAELDALVAFLQSRQAPCVSLNCRRS
jgi:ubiquinol-cytochrome c reductase cytochrome b subunit